jgi:hypothetical protein
LIFTVSTAAGLTSKPIILAFLKDFLERNERIPLPHPRSRIF